MTEKDLGSDEQVLDAVEDSNTEMVEDNAGPTDPEAEAAVSESNERQLDEEKEGEE